MAPCLVGFRNSLRLSNEPDRVYSRRQAEVIQSRMAFGDCAMARTFKVGDHVTWNSEAGRVSGFVFRVHTKDVNYKGCVRHVSQG
jgi:Hypervirulence associated proteins TUDOR domain